jgi:hypothetical protein
MTGSSRISARLSRSDSSEIIRAPKKHSAEARLRLSEAQPPRIDPEVIDYLLSRFPIMVSSGMNLREYDEMVGQQQVIAHLDELRKSQEG